MHAEMNVPRTVTRLTDLSGTLCWRAVPGARCVHLVTSDWLALVCAWGSRRS